MQEISDHYRHDTLEAALFELLVAAGKDPARLSIEDLAPVDEFHVGGCDATRELAAQMELGQGLKVLDIGSGIGGPARFLAQEYGCQVTGIDMTEEFVRVAGSLTNRVGLAHLASFCGASASALPFRAASFERAYMIHVGMNIPEKSLVFAETRRVLKPEGRFVIYDLVRDGPGDVNYPVPWATTPAISFLAPLSAYREGLEAAGFTILAERDRRDYAIEFFQRSRPVGLRALMGKNAAQKVANVADAIASGVVRPVEIVAQIRS